MRRDTWACSFFVQVANTLIHKKIKGKERSFGYAYTRRFILIEIAFKNALLNRDWV